MKKKIIIILIVLVSLLAVGGIVYACITVIDKANKDREQEQKIEKEIVDNFNAFKEAMGDFNIEWSTYNTVIETDINKNTVYQYDGWILSLDSYTQALDKVESTSSAYKKHCVGNYYSNKAVENKCQAFMDAYEKAINSYVKDIEYFNEMIDDLNKDRKEAEQLNKYELKYDKVDINNDKVYSEIDVKEESSSVK